MTSPLLRVSKIPARLPGCLFAVSAVAAALAIASTGLDPVAASAGVGHTARGRDRVSIAHTPCELKRGKKSSSRRHGAPRCAPARAHRRVAPGSRPSGSAPGRLPIEATSLTTVPVAPAPPQAPNAPAAPEGPGEGSIPAAPGAPAFGVTTNPIDPRYLTSVPFGRTSFWVQPWRAYMDTWPASRLLESAGINFNVEPSAAEPAAHLLQDSGFKLARVSIAWGAFTYDDPAALRPTNEAALRTKLTALHAHGLRPLIVLNANSLAPAPFKHVTLETVAAAPAGSRTVTLTAASAAQVVAGMTGFNALTFGGSPDLLIASVDPGGVATLARPLPAELPAGPHGATTLLYAPFASPTLAGGEPNPAYQATLAGWLSYVKAVCRFTAGVVGRDGFDLEVWNELSFGSEFLNAENYYSPEGEPSPEKGHRAHVTHAITRNILTETVGLVRNQASGISPAVGVSNGFASETPFPSGANAPLGLTALSKHPYGGARNYPAAYVSFSDRPVNALGLQDTLPHEHGRFTPLFIPTYQDLMPEYWLTANSTETLIRDIAPMTTEVYGFPHGRSVGPAGGPAVQKWVTEYNMSLPRGVGATVNSADKQHFHAKALLRSLVAMVNKGVSREYFFAAGPGSFSLIGPSFWSALGEHPGTYPGDMVGGEVMAGFRNMLARFQGPGPGGAATQLQLLSIAQDGNHAQFAGDGTPAHPSLYDREMLAVLPFQSSPTHFVIPVYVMTTNLFTLYDPSSTSIARYDLPNERFRITLGNLPSTGPAPTISAYDPLRDQNTPARLISRTGGTAVIEIAASDYPRLLSIDYPGT
jgi:hypothetical protein